MQLKYQPLTNYTRKHQKCKITQMSLIEYFRTFLFLFILFLNESWRSILIIPPSQLQSMEYNIDKDPKSRDFLSRPKDENKWSFLVLEQFVPHLQKTCDFSCQIIHNNHSDAFLHTFIWLVMKPYWNCHKNSDV